MEIEMGQERPYFFGTHFPQMAMVEKMDKSFGSGNIGCLGPTGKILKAAGSCQSVEKTGTMGFGLFRLMGYLG